MTDDRQDATGPLARRFAALLAEDRPGPVAADPASRALFDLARRAAGGRATVLVTGPSGAGKEVMARFLHEESPRAGAPFLAVNCAALPDAMLEAMLFGHERGAFTGAQGAAPGLFRAADGGTLFLDELGEMPLTLQAKLLRAVEQGEVLPLGATAPVKVDVRLLAATNRDLEAEVEAGRFRADLYWRLSVFPIALTPLAARPGDILPLAATLVRRLGLCARFTEPALEALLRHDWPGNVRELSNQLQRAAILAGSGPVGPEHLALPAAQPLTLADRQRHREARDVEVALAESAGRKGEAARRLGISERALRYKLAALAGRPRRRAAPPLQAAMA
ncbi:sigma 54-interacting transcriptional regulator [Sandaracinobacter sp. RS1-74]|uniref:sigma-54 interaction domain-containing protein n=1 Tax=Sandaracinobacteroides sayramensis TaxID=2913411 RepID=UPI001ED9F0F6|nr:sigma 54-interacting transcriptional regulator [Sandaracinobacteroides sayramensis]MCG2841967.1 sigma 54-interacting transcriptional regulator [Sandaracinobacteroides sayramensis]